MTSNCRNALGRVGFPQTADRAGKIELRRSYGAIAIALMMVVLAASALAGDRAAVLARFEQGWPKALKRLALDPARNYVVLVQVPSTEAIDSRSAETIRRSLGKRVFRGNRIGHMGVAWQCDGRKGIASQTGELSRQALRMSLAGWGMTPLLSTYTDGKLYDLKSFRAKHARILENGRGNILAVEVSSRACDTMKDFLVRYATHPNNPQRNFGVLFDPNKFEGGGCASFAVAMAAKAGILDSVAPKLRRTTIIYNGVLGRKRTAPKDVIPYVPFASSKKEVRPVPFNRMLRGPLDKAPVAGRVTFVDPELVFAAILGVRTLAGEPGAWYRKRLLDTGDGKVEAAFKAGRAWAEGQSTYAIADPEGLSAIVIHHSKTH